MDLAYSQPHRGGRANLRCCFAKRGALAELTHAARRIHSRAPSSPPLPPPPLGPQATALELRAEELQVKGDVRAGLLYEVAKWREEARRCALALAGAAERSAGAEAEARENALRAERAEADAHALKALLASARAAVEDLQASLAATTRVRPLRERVARTDVC